MNFYFYCPEEEDQEREEDKEKDGEMDVPLTCAVGLLPDRGRQGGREGLVTADSEGKRPLWKGKCVCEGV